ncbi:MAG: GntR family transcriptional regulator [Defluviitaleaceae bacterium]|nr:GntR family transcriptional regulator [Defluviitaleaceae bacterium]
MIFLENIPIYVQIADDIKDQIIAGKLCDDDKLLSIREYSLKYEVTALTMQRALALLESEGAVETKKGVGSFVKAGVREQLKVRLVEELVRDFISRAKNMGISNDEILENVREGLDND